MSDPRAIEAVSSREVGQIPISIGSSLALEGAFGILEDHPNPNPIINNVDVLYVNIRTLIRNMVGAINSEQLTYVFPEDLANALLNEITVLEGAVTRVSNGRVKVVPYLCNYRGIPKKFPYAILKNANTERQKMAALREENTVIEFLHLLQHRPDIRIIETDIDLQQDNRKVLMMTSYAVDLLQRYKFSSLTLLESHTGAAKPPALWYTKLTNGKELEHIPFDRMTLQFFGDNGNLFTGFPIKFRRVMLDIAKKNRWTALTTKDYIIQSVKKAYEPELEKLVMNLYAKA
ncbi:hypothetical protein PA10_00154 [Pseudomonas phage pPa_SNUABM_DT01]|nr:hypothetical protein PA10_00154 [Pseudomonas phage pPa_SNUABM_DT01]